MTYFETATEIPTPRPHVMGWGEDAPEIREIVVSAACLECGLGRYESLTKPCDDGLTAHRFEGLMKCSLCGKTGHHDVIVLGVDETRAILQDMRPFDAIEVRNGE